MDNINLIYHPEIGGFLKLFKNDTPTFGDTKIYRLNNLVYVQKFVRDGSYVKNKRLIVYNGMDKIKYFITQYHDNGCRSRLYLEIKSIGKTISILLWGHTKKPIRYTVTVSYDVDNRWDIMEYQDFEGNWFDKSLMDVNMYLELDEVLKSVFSKTRKIDPQQELKPALPITNDEFKYYVQNNAVRDEYCYKLLLTIKMNILK